ncbi:MAG: zf-HC2 domain-containing protein [Candidatus Hydrogenedentes bacterium]|nr:zf-HC2 domain-containing protein [Candidatus Hydrogenedentota bacterium]
MDRDEIRERFSPLLDGELSPEERAEVEAALAQDAELLRELDSLKRVDALYGALPPIPAPEGFEDRVHAALRPNRLEFGRARVLRQRMWPMLAAAAVFLVVGGYVLLQTQGPASKFDMAATEAPAADLAYPELDAAPSPSAARQNTAGSSIQAQITEEGQQERLVGKMSQQVSPSEAEPQAADTAAPAEAEPPASPQALAAQAPARANDFDYFDSSEGSPGQSSARRGGGEVRTRAATGTPLSVPAVPAESPASAAADEVAKSAPSTSEATLMESAGVSAERQPTAPEAAQPKDAEANKALAKGMPSESPAGAAGSLSEAAKEASSAFGSAYAPAPPPQAAPEAGAIESRTVAQRIFEHVDKRWIEKGYKGDKLTPITRGSKEWKALSTKAQPLDDVLKLEGIVVLRVKDAWYELLPEKPPSQPATSGH